MSALIAKRRPGRPSKFTADTVDRVLRSVEKGMPLTLAASAAGISFQSLCAYRQQHPQFAEAILEAIARGIEKRLEKIEAASDAGDWRAAGWLLEHTAPEFFAKTRIQVEAVGQLEHSFIIPQQTLNDIANARARQERQHDSIEVKAA